MLVLDDVRGLGERGLADELETGVAAVSCLVVCLEAMLALEVEGIGE